MFTLGSFERPANQERSFGGILAGLAQRYGLMIVVVAVIAYGTLYPFAFQFGGSLGADVSHLAGTWNQRPQSRGDILINLLLYMPFGFIAVQAIGWGGARLRAAIAAVALGAMLSLLLELIQFYDRGRFSTLSDVYLNVAGTGLGSALACAGGARRLRLSWPSGGTAMFARILLVAWVGWQLFPYAPTIDLHKYWKSIQPLLHASGMEPYTLFRATALWLSVIALARLGIGSSVRLVSLAIAGFFFAKILIIGQYVFLTDIAGAGLALILSPVLLRSSGGIGIVAALLAAAIVLARILPWQLASVPGAFQWIPFFGFLHGSLQLNLVALWQKIYLYGALLLLLVQMGMRLSSAAALACSLLLATSVLQVFLAARSAEITDAVMVLILALIYRFLSRGRTERSPAQGLAQ